MPPPLEVMVKTPHCVNQRQCDAMWVAAQDALAEISGMRLRIVTDVSRLETFAANGANRFTGTATRTPVAEGGYEIRATFTGERNYCTYNDVAHRICENQAVVMTERFNRAVTAAGAGF
jgi:hypothetical protein